MRPFINQWNYATHYATNYKDAAAAAAAAAAHNGIISE